MTSRERVLAAVQHREPDRVPVDLGSTPSTGISAIAYNKLKKWLGITHGNTRVYDVVQQLAQPEDIILDRFRIDAVDIGRTFNTDGDSWYRFHLTDGSPAEYPQWFHPRKQKDGSRHVFSEAGPEPEPGTESGTLIAVMPAEGAFFDQACFPYIDGYPENYKNLPRDMGKVLWAALVHSPWDNMDSVDFWSMLRRNALELKKKSDRALMIVVGCNLFEWGTFLRRMDNFLMDLAADLKGVERLLDALMEQHVAFLEKVCRAVGDVADIARLGDDLGMDQGPFLSPELYRKIFKPRHKELCRYVKDHSRMATFLHSCGSIYRLIPDLIDAGFDIINPVQTNTRNMEPEKLKKEFGGEITFWGGGIDTRNVLNRAKPEEVKDHVKRRLEIFSPGGGFVFNTIHNILPEVPPENIAAVFEAIEEFYL